jgi:hypothetical protein
MSLTINTLRDAADAAAAGNRIVVDRRLWLTADGSRAVEDGDPEAAIQLCSPGKAMLRAELERLGIKIKGGGKKRDKAPTEDKAEAPADNKGGAGVPGNVKAAKVTIAMADTDDLATLDELEADREDGPRTGVTKALAKRRAELES